MCTQHYTKHTNRQTGKKSSRGWGCDTCTHSTQSVTPFMPMVTPMFDLARVAAISTHTHFLIHTNWLNSLFRCLWRLPTPVNNWVCFALGKGSFGDQQICARIKWKLKYAQFANCLHTTSIFSILFSSKRRCQETFHKSRGECSGLNIKCLINEILAPP